VNDTFSKYYFPYIKDWIYSQGRTISDFCDSASRPPSRRTWVDATNQNRGVSRRSMLTIKLRIKEVGEKWSIPVPDEVLEEVRLD
jgi:hypothetical protein